jgi:hypothetical protein
LQASEKKNYTRRGRAECGSSLVYDELQVDELRLRLGLSPLAHEETKQGFALAFQREDMEWESASPGEGRVMGCRFETREARGRVVVEEVRCVCCGARRALAGGGRRMGQR